MTPQNTRSDLRTKTLRVAVLLSGSGRTLQNFLDLSVCGELPITVEVVISSRADAYGLKRAQAAGVNICVIERRGTPGELFSKKITDENLAWHGGVDHPRQLNRHVADNEIVCRRVQSFRLVKFIATANVEAGPETRNSPRGRLAPCYGVVGQNEMHEMIKIDVRLKTVVPVPDVKPVAAG